jgi:hypothetical protein
MKKETAEEASKMLFTKSKNQVIDFANELRREGMLKGAKWQQERSYSEEEAYTIWKAGQEYWKTSGESITFEELTEEFKSK